VCIPKGLKMQHRLSRTRRAVAPVGLARTETGARDSCDGELRSFDFDPDQIHTTGKLIIK